MCSFFVYILKMTSTKGWRINTQYQSTENDAIWRRRSVEASKPTAVHICNGWDQLRCGGGPEYSEFIEAANECYLKWSHLLIRFHSTIGLFSNIENSRFAWSPKMSSSFLLKFACRYDCHRMPSECQQSIIGFSTKFNSCKCHCSTKLDESSVGYHVIAVFCRRCIAETIFI